MEFMGTTCSAAPYESVVTAALFRRCIAHEQKSAMSGSMRHFGDRLFGIGKMVEHLDNPVVTVMARVFSTHRQRS